MSEKQWWDSFNDASVIDAALAKEGVSGKLGELVRSIYEQESSSGKNTATSNAGAVGGMQIIPGTFREVADKGWDINDPLDNARAGVRYLRKMFDRADGDPVLTAVGYYGGPGGQDKAKRGEAVADPRNPKAPNTLQYAQQVVDRIPAKQKEAGGWWDSFEDAKPSRATKDAPKAVGGSEPNAAKKDNPSLGGELLRQVGLTARAGVNGVAAIPAMLSDAITGPINAGLDMMQGDGNGFRFKKAGESLNGVMDAIGIPQPKNATERVVQDMASAMAGAGGTVAAGRALTGAGNAVAQRVGQSLAAGPGLQVTSAGAGAGASGAVREDGGGVGAQVAAGLAGGLAPALVPAAAGAAVRGAIRGGEAGRQAMAQRIQAFDDAGVNPTLGQATGGPVTRATESLLAKVPGGAGVMRDFANQQADDLATSVRGMADELAPGSNAVSAGEAITRGVNTFRDGVKAIQRKLYASLDQYIPAETPISVSNTRKALEELNAGINGAEKTSAMFRNSRIAGIEDALLDDLSDGTLPYDAIKQLRTLVGSELTDNTLVSDVPRAKWARLYGALSEDLGLAAKDAGPDAQSAWTWANTFTKSQMRRLEELQSIVGRDAPEKVFAAAVSGTAEGDTIAKRVISALPGQERREVAAALLHRLGRATPGQQNAAGDAFSSESFLTNLAKMSPEARTTLFGRTGMDEVLDRLDSFANVANTRREGGRIFANPSGTAPAAAQIGLGSGIAGGVVAAMGGQPLPLAGALAVPAIANAGAKALTSRPLVDFAARPTQLAEGAGAVLASAAAQAGRTFEEYRAARIAAERERLSVMRGMRSRAEEFADQKRGDAMAAIGKAASVDDAIAAAGRAVSMDQGRVVRRALESVGINPEDIDRADAAEAQAVQAANEAAKQPAPAQPDAAPKEAAAGNGKEPTRVWYGRRGDGYVSREDAERALKERARIQRNLDWRIEPTPDGKFRLAGYGLDEQASDRTSSISSERSKLSAMRRFNDATAN